MAFDRQGALKTAEKLLRLGRIDGAIEQYLRVVEAQPKDWNSANALGDLYVRAGQVDKGLAQYHRIAEHFATEGFYSKAAALYKKILKIRADDEAAMLQLGELAARQGLIADAKTCFQAVADRRRARGDRKGAAEMAVRLGTLDPDDLDARLGAARAAIEAGDRDTALRELREVAAELDQRGQVESALSVYEQIRQIEPHDEAVRTRLLAGHLERGDFARARDLAKTSGDLRRLAEALERAGRDAEALDVLAEAAAMDPGEAAVRARLAQAFVRRGEIDRARLFLTPEVAGSSPALWLALAEMELSAGRRDEGRAALARALELDPTQREPIVALGCRLAEQDADAGYAAIEAVAEAALAGGDAAAAAAALHEFVTRVRDHIVALMRLVEVCVDGGLEATMYSAQAQLADAYLAAGRGLEARIISEDLVAREPWDRANLERFRRALVMLGERDPDAIIADRLSGDSPFTSTAKLDLNEGVVFDEEETAPATGMGEPVSASELGAPGFTAAGPGESAPADEGAPVAGPPPRSLEQVLHELRDESARDSAEEAAAEYLRLAGTYCEMGMLDDAIESLQQAARSPRQRFEAASQLGRLCLERGDTGAAIEWFERAAEAPAPSAEAARSLLYELADTLERVGEAARALAVFVEIEAESPGYRDVAARIDRISKVQARG